MRSCSAPTDTGTSGCTNGVDAFTGTVPSSNWTRCGRRVTIPAGRRRAGSSAGRRAGPAATLFAFAGSVHPVLPWTCRPASGRHRRHRSRSWWTPRAIGGAVGPGQRPRGHVIADMTVTFGVRRARGERTAGSRLADPTLDDGGAPRALETPRGDHAQVGVDRRAASPYRDRTPAVGTLDLGRPWDLGTDCPVPTACGVAGTGPATTSTPRAWWGGVRAQETYQGQRCWPRAQCGPGDGALHRWWGPRVLGHPGGHLGTGPVPVRPGPGLGRGPRAGDRG